MEPFFNQDFFRSLTTTFLGAMFAILAAIGGWWIGGNQRRKADSLRRSQLAHALAETLEDNLGLARSASQLRDQGLLTVNVDLSLLDATRTLKYEVFQDINLSRDIDEIDYQLASLHRLIALRFEMEYSGTILAFSGRNQLRTSLSSLIRERSEEPLEYERRTQLVRRLKRIAAARSRVRGLGKAKKKALGKPTGNAKELTEREEQRNDPEETYPG
ncbi:MAG: hypothetical protein QGH97_10755 [Dehalococcoidia bacterium]|jgi:hypothetical protein|nr:hypothetical protein [Dehalococcoidia bacterium]MDP7199690.1 hypothetical protein [Dehalococcoidia bacterium]MDP7511369.1 hypothetical protein [Dehalococcoidia bacterium]HJN87323.1 hypothetical protein [Dehalococcoidia bacterium]